MNPRRPGWTRTLARAGALVAQLTMLGGLVSCAGSVDAPGAPALLAQGEQFAECSTPLKPAGWPAKRAEVVEFGLGYVQLRPGVSAATFTGATLHGVAGSLHLLHVALVPGGALGEGFEWGARRPIQFPRAWADRVVPPHGVLRARDPHGVHGYPSLWDGRTWQVVVGVQAGDGSGGMARGVTLAYTAGGRSYRFVQHNAVGVTRTGAQCDNFVDRSTPSARASR